MDKKEKIGTIYIISAYILWGILPLYWKALQIIPAGKILANRIIWSFIYLFVFLFISGRWKTFKETYKLRANRISSLTTALIIGTNWFIYIWAINSGHVVEASMGYFINPLLSVLLGVIVLKEPLPFWQGVSFCLALIGVLYLTLGYGRFPWIALSLAGTFALYGFFRKTSRVGSLYGLTAETALLSPLALTFVLYQEITTVNPLLGLPGKIYILLLGSGLVTAAPLVWFTKGARRIPLKSVGFLQYISPSIQLFLGVFIFKEQFTTDHLISFGLIWAALILFSTIGRSSKRPFFRNKT